MISGGGGGGGGGRGHGSGVFTGCGGTDIGNRSGSGGGGGDGKDSGSGVGGGGDGNGSRRRSSASPHTPRSSLVPPPRTPATRLDRWPPPPSAAAVAAVAAGTAEAEVAEVERSLRPPSRAQSLPLLPRRGEVRRTSAGEHLDGGGRSETIPSLRLPLRDALVEGNCCYGGVGNDSLVQDDGDREDGGGGGGGGGGCCGCRDRCSGEGSGEAAERGRETFASYGQLRMRYVLRKRRGEAGEVGPDDLLIIQPTSIGNGIDAGFVEVCFFFLVFSHFPSCFVFVVRMVSWRSFPSGLRVFFCFFFCFLLFLISVSRDGEGLGRGEGRRTPHEAENAA